MQKQDLLSCEIVDSSREALRHGELMNMVCERRHSDRAAGTNRELSTEPRRNLNLIS
jgi:hypothetical protein